MDEKEQFAQMVKQSRRIVAFTGAGMSTESGVPDFRSAGGLFDALSGNYFSGEETLSIGFLRSYPRLFFKNYARYFDFSKAEPNAGHRFFADLEKLGKDVTVVTQNIDNLHQLAGSTNVIELHGNGTKWRRLDEMERMDEALVRMDEDGMQRDADGEMVRPDIVLYGEALDEDAMQNARTAIRNADMLIVIGTSLNVYPAAAFIDYFKGPFAVLINRTAVPAMERFQLAIQTDAAAFLADVWGTYFRM
ncbi:Hypothetical protein Tpal_2450 [Trichococcus palustris]|uniref:protein acetyllysine N-acetyltransferase n=1 Tax=Trichococcus palustris TaxID=140314 RepID=A0A143YVZ7_9LACT|nr:NAD-dependent protein deacylase [Trichococcus palustris]CZQ99982.1 Hypothetical protein Tpal_2450 [Trichococcus palustris]SFL20707.1 NAD-dependent deacetylase [Trichococcus palustris]